MSLLKVTNLMHSFGDNVLLKNISFDLYDGEKMGLVGLNGSGKSTLLKILIGEMIQEDGEVIWRPNVSVGYLDQYAEINTSHTIKSYLQTAFSELYALEDRYNELNKALTERAEQRLIEQAAACQQQLMERGFYELDSRIGRVSAGLGVTALGMDKMIGNLSGGQRAKVILAKLLLECPDVLIMDEPTNFLDKSHIEWLTKYLNAFKGAFIVVSHHFDFLDGITTCICEIEFQMVIKYKGNLTAYLACKDMRKQQYIREYNAQRRFIEKTEDYIARNKARASTANMAKSREKMLSRIDRMTPPKGTSKPSFRFKCASLGNGKLLEVTDMEIGYTYPLLPKLSFQLEWGAKMVVTGFNGIGKTTLIKTLIGELPEISGGFRFHGNTVIGYFRQELAWQDDSLTPYEYISSVYPGLIKKQIYTALAQAGVGNKHIIQKLSTLSGGEQAKVRICQLMLTPCNLLILDEPTNHLDAAAKEVFKEALAEYNGSVILISHESSFYDGLVDALLNIEELFE